MCRTLRAVAGLSFVAGVLEEEEEGLDLEADLEVLDLLALPIFWCS